MLHVGAVKMHIKCSFCKDLCTLKLTYRKFSKKRNGKVLLDRFSLERRAKEAKMRFWKSEKKNGYFLVCLSL